MKVVITIENNKVVVETDDGKTDPINLVSPVIKSGTVTEMHTAHVPPEKDPFASVAETKPAVLYKGDGVPQIAEVTDQIASTVAKTSPRKYNRRGQPGGVNCAPRTKECEWEGCSNMFTYTTPTRKFCDEHRGQKRFPEEAKQPESSTKPCAKCQGDMPKHSMYDQCAACRGVKPKKCGFCERKGRPCKRHRNQQEEPAAASVEKPVEWCRKCQAYTTHKTEDHPLEKLEGNFMPGYEKTPEEIEQLRKEVEQPKEKFDDPWDCQMCRDRGHLCDFHHKMEKGGHHPKKTIGRAPDSGRTY